MGLFNIFRKPNVAPPSELVKPDLTSLDVLTNKYKPYLSDSLPQWIRIKEAFDDVILLNFASISFYMEQAVYPEMNKKKIEDQVKTVSTYSAFCGWVIGKEWATRNPELRTRLINKHQIELSDVPVDALELLIKAVNFLYIQFAYIFTAYYDSNFGRHLRKQKDGHLKDTYQSLMKGMLICFLAGIKS